MKQFKQGPVKGRETILNNNYGRIRGAVSFEYPEGTPGYRRGFTAAGRSSNHFPNLSTKRLSHHTNA